MPSRAQLPVYTTSETLVLGPGETLSHEDGTLEDVEYYFVECRKDPRPLEYSYRDLSEVYGGPNWTSRMEPYNHARLDKLVVNSPGTHYPSAYVQIRVTSSFTATEIDDPC